MRPKVCPRCDSDDVQRSRTRGPFERIVKSLLRLAPYRCLDCGKRFVRRLPEPSLPAS
jgi:transposase-like protein